MVGLEASMNNSVQSSMKKRHKQAKELLQAANKIYHYRRDLIPEARLVELEKAVLELRELMDDHAASNEALDAATRRLDNLLRKVGGKMHPKTFWNDNLEVALVATIIVIGVRTFFFQPFVIPTNSMYPTYSGMQGILYAAEEDAPNPAEKVLRFATLGARHKEVVAQNSGKIRIPFVGIRRDTGEPVFLSEPVQGRKFFILPAVRQQFTFFVDNTPHTLTVPAEFDMNAVLNRAFDVTEAEEIRIPGESRFRLLEFKQPVQAGDDILRFDIAMGDALFVDRLSYHFKKPQVGDPFVFRTDTIPGALENDVPKYYIKRLAGTGGETLEIRDNSLLVDGQPRAEADAFLRNAARESDYAGYRNVGRLAEGETMTIPENAFVALGDNSANSRDSRYWGFVPEKAVVGKAFFIYYPFTKRWGVAE